MNLFDSLQSRSSDKYGLDKDIFFQFINITGLWALRLFHRYSGTPVNATKQEDKI